jgi:enoyl-CoA hydratase/carnithine racemase
MLPSDGLKTPRVDTETDGKVSILTLNAPPANVFSSAMIDALNTACRNLPEETAVLIITGAGQHSFSAGLSIVEQDQNSEEENRAFFLRLYGMLDMIYQLPFPVIAALNGYTLGGGFELALSSDIRIADETAVMGAVGVTLGLVFSTQRLARLVGYGRAKELLFTGRRLGAREAQQLGLVEYVVPAGTALSQARKLAAQIANQDPYNLQAIKKAVNQGLNLELSQGLEVERRYLFEMLKTDNYRQRIKKFVEKR